MKTITFGETTWQLVPVCPTEEMISAIHRVLVGRAPVSWELYMYDAMLAAAPEAPDTEPVNVQLLEAPELTDDEITAIEKTCWGYEAFSWDDRLYLNHVKFARAVIAADRAKRGG